MSIPNKIEAAKKVADAMPKQNVAEPERVAPNKEQFQSLLNVNPNTVAGSNRLDTQVAKVDELEPGKNPILADESMTSQKTGSATDQENKRQKSSSGEVEEVEGTESKKTTTSLPGQTGELSADTSVSPPTPEKIKTQAKAIISQLEEAKEKIVKSPANIQPSYQRLLRNHLTHIDDNLKIALSKVGAEYTPEPPSADKNKSPLHRFIDAIANSQSQLENIQATVDRLNQPGRPIQPAEMLAIQLKMGYVQQQVELFSNLLNKALEAAKTVMNVQV